METEHPHSTFETFWSRICCDAESETALRHGLTRLLASIILPFPTYRFDPCGAGSNPLTESCIKAIFKRHLF